jgi:tetratricopeptide (TPR) repeat protein
VPRRFALLLVLALLGAGACKDKDATGDGPAPAAGPPPPEVAAATGQSGPSRESVEDHGDDDPHDHQHRIEESLILCPLAGDELRDADALLDESSKSFDVGNYGAALACAEVAADLLPQAVEAHHVRAAAHAALGHHDEAQVAFTMALALDPDDPQTLAAAADFYINVLPPKRRETTMVGYEYARRGRARSLSRRDRDPELRARLALLEAQALNDLARSDEALSRIGEALALAPRMIEARHERGVAMFNLCRFDEAREAFLAVLSEAPEDPYAHHHLALIYERTGSEADAEAHFRRARELAPDEFWAPVILEPDRFRAELDEAIAELDDEDRALLASARLEVTDVPALADLTAVDPPFSPTILGLYRGLPHGVKVPAKVEVPERAIVLYRKNLGRAVRTRDELDQQIRRTLVHEIGHLRGLDEDELRRRGLD